MKPNLPDPPPVALAYVRVSTNRQDLSVATQIEQVQRAARYHTNADDATVEIFAEPDTSGSIPFFERDQGKALLARIEGLNALALLGEKSPPVTLIVPKVDRLGRDAADISTTTRHLDELGVRLVFLDLNVDTRSATGRACMQLMAVFAELERNRIRERITEAFATKRTRHEHMGGSTAPYGWDKVATGRTTAKGVAIFELVPNPTEQRHLLNMVAMREAGLGFHTIAKQLNQLGVPTKGGIRPLKVRGKKVNGRETSVERWTSGKWTCGNVQGILENATVQAWLAQPKQQAA